MKLFKPKYQYFVRYRCFRKTYERIFKYDTDFEKFYQKYKHLDYLPLKILSIRRIKHEN